MPELNCHLPLGRAEADRRWSEGPERFGAYSIALVVENQAGLGSVAQKFTGALVKGRREKQSRWSAEAICQEMSNEIFQRLCEGDSLTAIGRDPLMPSLTTIMTWRRRFPAFEELVQLGMRARAERACDEGWELAMAATPETAYLTHVRLSQLRWMAGVMAPRVYRIKQVEPDAARERLDVLIRRFEVEVDPATGERRVVAFTPNSATGEVEREDDPERRPMEGSGSGGQAA